MGHAIRFFVGRFRERFAVVEGQEVPAIGAGDGMAMRLREATTALGAPQPRIDGAVDVVSVAE